MLGILGCLQKLEWQNDISCMNRFQNVLSSDLRREVRTSFLRRSSADGHGKAAGLPDSDTISVEPIRFQVYGLKE